MYVSTKKSHKKTKYVALYLLAATNKVELDSLTKATLITQKKRTSKNQVKN